MPVMIVPGKLLASVDQPSHVSAGSSAATPLPGSERPQVKAGPVVYGSLSVLLMAIGGATVGSFFAKLLVPADAEFATSLGVIGFIAGVGIAAGWRPWRMGRNS